MSSDKRSERMLEELLKVPGNNYCADCHSPSPRWASVNLGITLCVSCATIHRKLGTHKSRVKSITLDTWSREHIQQLRQVGNKVSNQIYNPDESKNPPPTSSSSDERDSEMEKYIRKKYELGAFKAGAKSAVGGVNSRDRYRAAQGLAPPINGRNPELNNLVFKKSPVPEKERDLPPLPPLSASRTGSSASAGGAGRERPKPAMSSTPISTLIDIQGEGTANSTLPLQQTQTQPIPTFTQTGFNVPSQSHSQNGSMPMFIPQQPQHQQQQQYNSAFSLSPQPQSQAQMNGMNGGSYFPNSTTPIQSPPAMMQQYTNNPFMQQQSNGYGMPQHHFQQPEQPQNTFLSPIPSPAFGNGSGNGYMATSPGGTNPFLQMQHQQQTNSFGNGGGNGYMTSPGAQMQGQSMWGVQGNGNGWNGQQAQGQGQGGWQGQQQQHQQQQQQMYPNMGMAGPGMGMGMGMGMGYAQGR